MERRDDWKPFPVLPFFAVLQETWYLTYSSWPHGHLLRWLMKSTEFCPLRRVKKWCGIKNSCVGHCVLAHLSSCFPSSPSLVFPFSALMLYANISIVCGTYPFSEKRSSQENQWWGTVLFSFVLVQILKVIIFLLSCSRETQKCWVWMRPLKIV